MNSESLALFYALMSAAIFSGASIVFTKYAIKCGANWINITKACIALMVGVCVIPFFEHWPAIFSTTSLMLIVSGASGLAYGDIFLMRAFAELGASRSLMMFGLQPIFLAIFAYVTLGQKLNILHFLGIPFLLVCPVLFSLERFRSSGSWDIKGVLFALVAVGMDACGIMLSRTSFELTPSLHPFQANVYRFSGAIFAYLLILPFIKINWRMHFNKLQARERGLVILASFMGTCVSLAFVLTAFKIGKLAAVSAVGVTCPIFAATLECLVNKKMPSKYLISALISFTIGFLILIQASI